VEKKKKLSVDVVRLVPREETSGAVSLLLNSRVGGSFGLKPVEDEKGSVVNVAWGHASPRSWVESAGLKKVGGGFKKDKGQTKKGRVTSYVPHRGHERGGGEKLHENPKIHLKKAIIGRGNLGVKLYCSQSHIALQNK